MEFVAVLTLYTIYKVVGNMTACDPEDTLAWEYEQEHDPTTADWHFVKRNGKTYFVDGPYKGS